MKRLNKSFQGIVGIYKPIGPTSHDMIYRVRRLTGVKKVGHAGTLDPLAEGVLVVAIGREFTKKLSQFLKVGKEYVTEIKLGETSTTDDAEGEKEIVEVNKKIEIKEIRKITEEFVGEIWQIPPIYSAVKVKGKPAHRLVRKGEEVQLEPRKREVKQIEILDYQWPILKLRIVTGSGVYIRSLARDIGEKLGIGGYMQSLVRTRVGEYTLEDCYQVENEN